MIQMRSRLALRKSKYNIRSLDSHSWFFNSNNDYCLCFSCNVFKNSRGNVMHNMIQTCRIFQLIFYFKFAFITIFVLHLVETIHNFEWGETNVLQTRSKSFSVSSCHELVLFILLVSLRNPLLRPRFHFKQVRTCWQVYLEGVISFEII